VHGELSTRTLSRTVKSAVPDCQAQAGVFCSVDRASGLRLEAWGQQQGPLPPEWTLFAIPSHDDRQSIRSAVFMQRARGVLRCFQGCR
jgi:hypothetical protein